MEQVLKRIIQYKDRIIQHSIIPRIYWQRGSTEDYVEIVEYEEQQVNASVIRG